MEDKNLVERAMEELGVNQTQLVELSGVSESTLIDWKKGRTKIPKWGENLLNLMIKSKKDDGKLEKLSNFFKLASEL